ncbi:MAG: trypsin-like peptidase domain-containing protein [Bacteroidales bacterium]
MKKNLISFWLCTFFVTLLFSQTINTDVMMQKTVLIITDQKKTGSGFYLYDSSFLYLVTADHVLRKKDTNSIKTDYVKSITVTSYPTAYETSDPIKASINIAEAFKNKKIIKPRNQDIIIIIIGVIKEIKKESSGWLLYEFTKVEYPKGKELFIDGFNIYNIIKFSDVKPGRDVIAIGFPTSLANSNSQYHYNRPLLRKGVVSAKDIVYRNIIIDCKLFPGNSGGPVYMNNSKNPLTVPVPYGIIGIVSEFVPFDRKDKDQNVKYLENSGLAVITPLDVILDYLQDYRKINSK